MKAIMVLFVFLVLVVVTLGIILCLASPRAWPMTAGSITAKKVFIEGRPFIMVGGEPMNYLGQIQSINIEFDDSGKRLVVSRCLIRWNPFTKIRVNNQWPVFYPLEDMKLGKYPVVYISADGEQTAGIIDVP